MIPHDIELKQAIKKLENTKISNSLEQFSGDLNTIKTTSFTYATGTASNIPVAGYSFYITTIALNEYYTYQEARRVDENTNNFNTYERQCYGGVWTDWKNQKSMINVNVNTDFNNITKSGIYQFNGSIPTGSNKPNNCLTGFLEVFDLENGILTQQYTNYDGSYVHRRGKVGDNWTDWVSK